MGGREESSLREEAAAGERGNERSRWCHTGLQKNSREEVVNGVKENED